MRFSNRARSSPVLFKFVKLGLVEDLSIVAVGSVLHSMVSRYIDKEAAVNAEGLWCVERGQFAEWASRAIGVLKRYIRQNKNPRDDPDFETNMSNMLRAAKVDSQSFLDFIRHKKLSNLKKD